jgi:hypothetical protein
LPRPARNGRAAGPAAGAGGALLLGASTPVMLWRGWPVRWEAVRARGRGGG